MDKPIRIDDVQVQPSTLYTLRKLQDEWMAGNISEEDLLKSVDAVKG